MEESIRTVGQWEGYRIGTLGPANEGEECWVELLPGRTAGTWGGGGRHLSQVHDTEQRWIDDLPILQVVKELLNNWHIIAERLSGFGGVA